MPQQTISLNDTHWQFGHVPRRPFTEAAIADAAAVTEWLPATVPGNVRTDLLAHHRIPNPLTAQGYQHSQWVDDRDWWYRRQLPPLDLAPGQRAFVRFCGLDYLSAILVNGREVARHEGMFSHQTIEITPAHPDNPPLELAVRLWGSGALPTHRLSPAQRLWQKIGGAIYRSWVGLYPPRTATLKSQMSFGWDFAPPIRTIGIWDEVDVLITGPTAIQDLAVSLPESGRLTLRLALHSARPIAATAVVSVTPANFPGEALGQLEFPLRLPAGPADVTLRGQLPPPALWQPWDRGFPHLYHVTVSLIDPAGQLLDGDSRRTGCRTIDLPPFTPPPPGPHHPWQFRLNHQPEFIRGLNWVPADSLPGRLRRPDYERLLHLARQSGANLLRVWGGGLREKRAFYDLCDELGLLVWQEFPFACEFLGAYPRHPAYLELVARECGDIVRQLRHHPALALWGGGNEFRRLRNRPLLDTLARVVARCDGSRPFVPVSPSHAHGGDVHHWRVWHGLAPLSSYQQETARFLSEFGLQSLPDSMANEDLPVIDEALIVERGGDLVKLGRYAGLFNKNPHPSLLIPHSPFTIHHSQLAQAIGLQTAIEHIRRRKGYAGGLCLWQFNEPWPAVSWAIIDYSGRPKLAWHMLRTWYAPLLVSLEFPVGRRWAAGDEFSARLWLINDSLDSYPACAVQIDLTTAHAQFPLHHSPFVTLPPNCALPLDAFTYRLPKRPASSPPPCAAGEKFSPKTATGWIGSMTSAPARPCACAAGWRIGPYGRFLDLGFCPIMRVLP